MNSDVSSVATSCLREKGQWDTTMNKSDYKYFDKARQAAMVSDYYKTHIGCVAVYQGGIIGIGCNCNKTHPAQKFYNKYRKHSEAMLPKLHAEISCINSIKHLDINFLKVKLYIYRIRKDQPFGLVRQNSISSRFHMFPRTAILYNAPLAAGSMPDISRGFSLGMQESFLSIFSSSIRSRDSVLLRPARRRSNAGRLSISSIALQPSI